ncbi:Piso0_001110 [Millerozyma farinosa CBS 7064]|uniref:Piso0_001110 protein n=1 Tax=Pichia sorbitophila (strain ATCC MYA-4447 / BCRC 22081 / CBS 7064 / NBRC 10061 / NRRL Y-12695) TaxID=559304 RepID=G8YQY8_PICSO|nr:Piso0_001110 [Millerozyma farinosa CBS 7064]CCE79073.1 Piso0_001110 [Millerozyma farinosa CBS 7064]
MTTLEPSLDSQTRLKGEPSAAKGSKKGAKNKRSKDAVGERRLPNGEKVDFGHGNGKKTSKKAPKQAQVTGVSRLPDATLPDGSKPVFHEGESEGPMQAHKASNGPTNKKKGSSDSSSQSGEKSVSHKGNEKGGEKINKKKGKSKDKKPTTMEDTYAGSSFHFSPEALNLPKPSFKTSPKTANPTQNTSNMPMRENLAPIGNAAPVPQPARVPQQPAAFPAGHPFYANYAYGFPMQPFPGQYTQAPVYPQAFSPGYPPYMPAAALQQGQKITFNELLGSVNH